jgi:hypothetical protein
LTVHNDSETIQLIEMALVARAPLLWFTLARDKSGPFSAQEVGAEHDGSAKRKEDICDCQQDYRSLAID